MSEPTSALQFDRAEFEGGAAVPASCSACQRPLSDVYFEVGGAVTCDVCRQGIEAEFNLQSSLGARVGRLARGLSFGLLGAVASGGALSILLIWREGTIWGFFSILVGLAVGAGVRAGCRGRGGWLYQAIAMSLTYVAINTATFAAAVRMGQFDEMLKGQTGPAGWFVLGIVGIAVVAAAPFLTFADGLGNGLLSLLIIGFGLYEAWKLNRKQTLQITGPYSLAARTAPPPIGA